MWVVMRIVKFEFEISSPLMRGAPASLDPRESAVGYLPVYETREAAEKDYPDGPFQEIARREESRHLA